MINKIVYIRGLSLLKRQEANERNVNHKKLRAFKSLTRWCTFTLITLHLSFSSFLLLLDTSLCSFFFFFSLYQRQALACCCRAREKARKRSKRVLLSILSYYFSLCPFCFISLIEIPWMQQFPCSSISFHHSLSFLFRAFFLTLGPVFSR